MTRFAAPALALALLAPLIPARAGDGPPLPRFDPNARCAAAPSLDPSSPYGRSWCLREAQSAYDTLRAIWPSVPAATREWVLSGRWSDHFPAVPPRTYVQVLNRLDYALRLAEARQPAPFVP